MSPPVDQGVGWRVSAAPFSPDDLWNPPTPSWTASSSSFLSRIPLPLLLASLPLSDHPQRPKGLLATHPERPGSLGHGKLEHCSLSLLSVTERSVQPLPEFAAWEVTHAQSSTLEEGEILVRAGGTEDCTQGRSGRGRAPGQMLRWEMVPLRQNRGRFTSWPHRDGDPEVEATAALRVLCTFFPLLIKVTCSCLSSLSPPGGTKRLRCCPHDRRRSSLSLGVWYRWGENKGPTTCLPSLPRYC